MTQIMRRRRSIIIACDVPDLDALDRLLSATAHIEEIGGYKIGLSLALRYGLPIIAGRIRASSTGKVIIYDHQKASRDIPQTGDLFAQAVRDSDADAMILYPNPPERDTALSWLLAARSRNVPVIFGSWMTTPRYASNEGGPYAVNDILAQYRQAAECGVRDFVVPGNKIDATLQVVRCVRELCLDPVLYAPGFGRQGGSLPAFSARVPGSWHPIIGSDLIDAPDMRERLMRYVEHL